MWEERDKMMEEQLNKKKPGLDDLEKSQPGLMVKTAKIKKLFLKL